MKKLIAILMAMAMSLCLLTACGSNAEKPAASGTASAATSAADAQPAASAAAGSAASSAEAAASSSSTESAEEKTITLTVTYADETSDVFTITTDAETLFDAIEDCEDVELGGSVGDYGYYIESVNGITADFDTDGAYWAIFVGEDYGMYSVDTQPVEDGGAYALVYTVG